MNKHSIKKAAALLIIATILEKIFGMLRDMVIAKQFGASNLTDSYIAGYLIPNFITTLLSAGLVNVYAPVFMSERDINEDAAWTKINSISTYLVIIISVVAAAGILFSQSIVGVLYSGFSEENISITSDISRLFFVGVIVYSITIIEGSLLNCYRHFVYSVISVGLLSLGTIIWVMAFGGSSNINSVAYGFIFGALLGIIIQYIKIKSIKGKIGVNFRIYPEFAGKFAALLFPVLVATSMSQINVFVDRIFGSYLPEGSMSYLSYGNKVVELPIVMFSGIIATIIFPELIDYINREDRENLRIYTTRAMIISLLFLVPSLVGMDMLNREIVKLLYERDAFSSIDTVNTASALLYYSPTVVLYGIMAVVSKVYYSMKDTKTLMYISVVTIILNAALDYVLMKPMGHNGLALATSIVALFQLAAAYIVLKRKIGLSMGIQQLKSFLKIIGASAVMAAVLFIIREYVKISSAAAFAGLSIFIGAAVYFIILIVFRVDELNMMLNKIRKRRTEA